MEYSFCGRSETFFSVVHHVARRVGEVFEDQRTQVHAAGWADAGAGEE